MAATFECTLIWLGTRTLAGRFSHASLSAEGLLAVATSSRFFRRYAAAASSLKTRLAVAGALLIALSVAATVAYSVREAQTHTEQSIIDSNLGVARIAATLSSSVIEHQRALAAAAAAWPQGESSSAGRTRAFVAGQGVLRTLFNDVLVVPADALPIPVRDGPVVTPPIPDFTERGAVDVLVACTLPDSGAKPLVLVGALHLGSDNFLSTIARVAQPDDPDVRTVVADEQGRTLAHADPRRLMTAVESDPVLRPAVQRWQQQGRPMEPAPWTGRLGDQFVAMAAVPGTDWMVFRIAGAEALFGKASRSIARTVMLGAGVGLAGAAAIFAVTAWFLLPMSRLRQRALRALDRSQPPGDDWPDATGEVGELTAVLKHVSEQLASSRDDTERSLQKMQAVMAYSPVGIGFTDEERLELVSSQLERLLGYEAGELVGASWHALVSPEISQDDARDAAEAAFRQGLAFETELPLRHRDGSILWAHVQGAAIEGQGTRRRLIWIVSDATDARRQRETLVWNATRDPLTELVNRREFDQQLDKVVSDRRRHDRASALFIDLDHFKKVNDNAGHAAGDALLRRIAQVLRERTRAQDTVARLGGDEFAVLLRGCALDRALSIADQIRQQVEIQGVCDTDSSLRVTASIGVVEIDAAHRSLAEVLAAADRACYAAKHAGRNAVRHAAPGVAVADATDARIDLPPPRPGKAA
jgi:diguanylate cyclase (GGDEF)-like protein/PAS domain S-box-containing protein